MGSRQIHDQYGKKVMARAFGQRYNSSPERFKFGDKGGSAKIDGTIDGDIAVEIESRGGKQVRGALVDLILHSHQRLLLVIIKKHGNQYLKDQSEYILGALAHGKSFQIVVLEGSGDTGDEFLEDDVTAVREAVELLTVPDHNHGQVR